MKKLIAVVSALLLTASFATPAQSAGAKYTVYQKTLATYSGSATGLSSVQKAQVRATVEANPNAEKFICTGIRYFEAHYGRSFTLKHVEDAMRAEGWKEPNE